MIEQLSEGFFELFRDGTFQKMEADRIENIDQDESIGTYSSVVGIDPLFISDGKTRIVIDPGLGWGLDYNSRYQNSSNIVTNLEIFNIKPSDVDFVILTHLHYDHAAGSTLVNQHFETAPSFPNARYLVHSKEWKYAIEQLDDKQHNSGIGYQLDELYRLAADGYFHLIEEDSYKPTDGIELILTGGHTPGHMVVRFHDGKNSSLFLGDLVPSENQLNQTITKGVDFDPVQAKKMKTRLLREAFDNNSTLYFYHSLYRKSGRLSKDKRKQYVLLDI